MGEHRLNQSRRRLGIGILKRENLHVRAGAGIGIEELDDRIYDLESFLWSGDDDAVGTGIGRGDDGGTEGLVLCVSIVGALVRREDRGDQFGRRIGVGVGQRVRADVVIHPRLHLSFLNDLLDQLHRIRGSADHNRIGAVIGLSVDAYMLLAARSHPAFARIEEAADHLGNGAGVGHLQMEELDLRAFGGIGVEFGNQCFGFVQRFGWAADDDGVGAGIGRDDDALENSWSAAAVARTERRFQGVCGSRRIRVLEVIRLDLLLTAGISLQLLDERLDNFHHRLRRRDDDGVGAVFGDGGDAGAQRLIAAGPVNLSTAAFAGEDRENQTGNFVGVCGFEVERFDRDHLGRIGIQFFDDLLDDLNSG